MAADPKDIQDIVKWEGVKLPRNLDTPRRVRLATAQVLRAMADQKIHTHTGKSLIWGLTQLHGMINNESAPAPNPGTVVNIAMVAGEVSPGVRLVRELASARDIRRLEGVVQDRPLCPDDAGVEPA